MRVALEGLLGRKLRHGADRDRDRARRRDGHGHVHPHRLDQGRVRRDLHARSTAAPTRPSPASRRSTSRRPVEHDRAAVRRVAARARCATLPGRRRRRRRRRRRCANLVGHERQGDRLRRRAEPRLQRRPDGDPQLQHADARRGQRGRRPDEVVDRRVDRGQEGPRGRRSTIGVEAERPGAADARSPGSSSSAARRSLGGATLAGFDLPTAQALFDKDGQARPDPREGEAGVSRPSSSRRRSRRSCRRGTQVRTGEAQAKEDATDTTSFIASCRTSCSRSAASRSSSARS